MPFAIFRKYQRKLLAVFAILAMFSFVLSDSLPSWIGGRNGSGRGANDPVVAKLKWKTVHASDLEPMRLQRQRANYFVASVFQGVPQYASFFGGTTPRDLIDALILEHEADRLGMPTNVETANRWLRARPGGMANARLFEKIFRGSSLSQQVTEEQLLTEIANQIRIRDVLTLPITAEVTPLDMFEAYKDQTEKVSAFAVPVLVDEYLSQVPDPTTGEVQSFYDSAKDRLPSPSSPDAGFKVAQKVRYEVVTADVPALADAIRPKLTPQELRETYEARKADFPASPGELPTSVFAGAPDLTPHDAFPDVRDRVSFTLAEERARDEVGTKFDDLKNNVMRPFEDQYYATDADGKPKSAKPKEGDILKAAADKAGLTFERTPLVPATAPDGLGPIAKAMQGSSASFDNPPFLSLAYTAKTQLFDPLELVDERGRRFLTWKIEDVPPRVPPLDEIRAEVVKAWKREKARPLAEAEAKTIASRAEKAGGGAKIKDVAGARPVITTEARSKLVPAMMFGSQSFGSPRPAEIPEIPHAGVALRDAIYDLAPKTTVVAADDPKDTYYALSLRDREPVDFAKLFAPGLGTFMLREVSQEAYGHRIDEWRKALRIQAGLPADWVAPSSDRKGAEDLADSAD